MVSRLGIWFAQNIDQFRHIPFLEKFRWELPEVIGVYRGTGSAILRENIDHLIPRHEIILLPTEEAIWIIHLHRLVQI